MTSLPVTVIIPTWNRAHLLPRALESVFRQTAPCSEVIVVDDGSTDDTAVILQRFQLHQPTLRVLRQANKGVAAARNLAINAAGNEYLAFLDSDDHWQRKKLEKQYAALSRSDFLISNTYEQWLRCGEHLNQKKIHIPRHGDIFEHSLRLCTVGMSTVMVRKVLFTKVGMFNEELCCCEDYDFFLRVSLFFSFLLLEEVLTVKEGGRADQLSHIYRMGMDEWRIASLCRLLAEQQLTEEQKSLAETELVRKLQIFGTGCLKYGRIELGQQYLAMIKHYQNTKKQ